MDHSAGIAVIIDRKVVNHKIPHYFFQIQNLFQILCLGKGLQRGNQPCFVVLCHICFGTGKDGGIAFRIVIHILQLCAVAAEHTSHIKSTEAAHVEVRRRFSPACFTLRNLTIGGGY